MDMYMTIAEHINRDHKDIYNLLNIISNSDILYITPNLVKLMPLLLEVKDTMELYWNLRQDIIFNNVRLSHEQEYNYLDLLEAYTQASLLISRCLKTIMRNDVQISVIQTKLLCKTLKEYLDDEMNYLNTILPEYFSDNELRHMGKNYELSKIYPHYANQALIH